MGRSLSLAAYRALSWRTEAASLLPYDPRPVGELVWIHAAEAHNLSAVTDVAQRLCAARHGLSVLITVAQPHQLQDAQSWRTGRNANVYFALCPSEHPSSVTAFLSHWSPDACLWVWGALRPNLVDSTVDSGCPLVLIDGDADGFDGRRDRWLPDVTRSLLAQFHTIMVRSEAGLARLQRLGLPTGRLDLMAPLQAGGPALLCEDKDIAEMAGVLSGRPVWLATGIQGPEVAIVLAAHRRALRLSHRLLLILNPAENVSVENCLAQALADDFRVRNWGANEYPEDMTQVLLAGGLDDLGLFYRLAPVSFLGSSLVTGHGGRNPFEAAALGSAVLYGPNVRQYLPSYTRLANAGAARIVNDAISLGTAVTRLVAPDQAAVMAHAGWDVVSSGADQTDRVVLVVQNILDKAERTA